MAIKVINPPFESDVKPQVTSSGYRWFLQTSEEINKTAHSSIPVYADNTAALAGGLVAGDFYHTAGGDVKIVV